MSKMGEMAATIEELRSAAAAINEVANWLAQQFSTTEEAHTEEAKTPEKPTLTLEQVRAVLAEKSRVGHTAAIRTVMYRFKRPVSTVTVSLLNLKSCSLHTAWTMRQCKSLTLPAARRFLVRSSRHWKMSPLSNGPSTPPLNASVSPASSVIPPVNTSTRKAGAAP